LILAAIVAAACLLRVIGISQKRVMTHDEAISYLAATGHQGEYAEVLRSQGFPYGRWVEAKDWQRFLLPEKRFCFKVISRDLADYDIHPPLYFWLLHVWVLIWGVQVWSGAALNVALDALLALVLFVLAKDVLNGRSPALWVVAVWAFNQGTIAAGSEGRQYPLLALCTAALALLVFRYSRPDQELTLVKMVLLLAVTTAGALSHYLFFLPVVGAVGFLALRLWVCDRRRLVKLAIVLLGGYVLFCALHPGCYRSVMRQHHHTQQFDAHRIPMMLKKAGSSVGMFFAPFAARALSHGILPPELLGLLGLTVLIVLAPRESRKAMAGPGFGLLSWFILTTSLGSIILCITAVTPSHAAGPKQFAFAYPFLAFVPFLLPDLTLLRRPRLGLVHATCILLIFLGIASEVVTIGLAMRTTYVPPTDSASLPVLVNTESRGYATRLAWQLQSWQPVLVARQSYLVEHKDVWLSRLNETGGIYAVRPEEGGGEAADATIIRLLEQANFVQPLSESLWGIMRGYLIVPKGQRAEG